MGGSPPPNHPRRCKAKCSHEERRGKPCGNWAIRGGTVCSYHGGKAKHVRAAATNRLLDVIDPDRVFREMARIGFADTSQIFDEQGNIKPIKDWPPSLRRALAGVEVVKRNLTAGDGEIDQVLKVKFWDKPKVLEQMAKILQMFVEKHEHSGGIEISWKDSE